MGFQTLIQAEELAPHLHRDDWVVVDCRFDLAEPAAGRRAYDEAHIINAVYADLAGDLSGPVAPGKTGRHPLPDPSRFAQNLSRWGAAPTSQIVAYDDSGGAYAARLWWLARWFGHVDVAVLDGGWKRWCALALPTDHNAPCGRQVEYPATPSRGMWLDADQVTRALASGAILADARAHDRFVGEHEPIDSVAGHIPGARNLPWQANLDADGRFLPPERLRTRFAAVLAARPPEALVHYCGSGVTAAHNLLAMEAAGLAGSRLFVGSWSDWITDPSRPIARGE